MVILTQFTSLVSLNPHYYTVRWVALSHPFYQVEPLRLKEVNYLPRFQKREVKLQPNNEPDTKDMSLTIGPSPPVAHKQKHRGRNKTTFHGTERFTWLQ